MHNLQPNLIDHYIDNAINDLYQTTNQHRSSQSDQHDLIPELSLNEMMLLASLAEQQAKMLGIDIVFALVDRYGLQRFYFSMPNALLVSHTLAPKKAYSAVAMKMPTHKLAEMMQPNTALFGVERIADICGVGGGFPCLHQNRIIAGIGISGGTVEEDMLIAINCLSQFSQQCFPLNSN